MDQIIHLENWVRAAPSWVALCKLRIHRRVAFIFVCLTRLSYSAEAGVLTVNSISLHVVDKYIFTRLRFVIIPIAALFVPPAG